MDDYQKYRVVMDILQLGGMGAIAVYTWVINRTKATKNAIDQVRGEHTDDIRGLQLTVHELSVKVDLQEKEISHLPNHDHLSELHEKVNAVNNTLSTLAGEMKSINLNLTLVLEGLIKGGNR